MEKNIFLYIILCRELPKSAAEGPKYKFRTRGIQWWRIEELAAQKVNDGQKGYHTNPILFHPKITDPKELVAVLKKMESSEVNAKTDFLYLFCGNHNTVSDQLAYKRLKEKGDPRYQNFTGVTAGVMLYPSREPRQSEEDYETMCANIFHRVRTAFCMYVKLCMAWQFDNWL